MKTEYVKINNENYRSALVKSAKVLKEGGLVAFPTETVYGLGADAFNPEAVKSIFSAKGRPADNPLILHISDLKLLEKIVADVPETAKKLMERFWPGPLTIIMNKKEGVIDEVTAGLDTVAVRMPSNKIAFDLISECQIPVAAPSANKSTRPSPTRAEDVAEDLDGEIDIILDGGPTVFGLESTVIDVTCEPPAILRPGYITVDDFLSVIDDVVLDKSIKSPKAKPKSPGQKYKHYAPKAEVFVFVGSENEVAEKMNEFLKTHSTKIGCIVTSGVASLVNCDIKRIISEKNDFLTYAKSIFSTFRDMDHESCDYILVEGVSEDGYGEAIMNRLNKSSSGKIIYL